MFGAALLKTIEDAGVAILTLTEGWDEHELLSSRVTKAEVLRQFEQLLTAASRLPPPLHEAMAEIDWTGLAASGTSLNGPPSHAADDALLFVIRSLVPATLMWLRIYRQQNPQWFRLIPA